VANRKVTLVANIKTAQGWRRYPVAWGKNGRIKPGTVIVGGKEQKFTEGVYQLRTYEGSRMAYKPLPNANAQDAANARDREASLLAAREHATEAGAKIVEETGRVYLRRAFAMYIQDRENRNTLEAKAQAELVGEEFLTMCGRTFVDEVVTDDIYRFHKALRNRKAAPRTLANKHERLKSILLFAGVSKDVIPPTPKYDKALPTTYTPDEVKAIRAAADEQMLRIIDLCLKCGLREQEAMHLEWPDIHWSDKVLRVQSKPEFGFRVKDSEERDVPVPDDLLERLRAHQAKNPKSRLVVGTDSKGNPKRHLLRTLKQVARRAKLICETCEGCTEGMGCERWTLHKFRRTYATTLLRNGVDLRTVQRFMGHSDLGSTMRYLRPASSQETQTAVNAIRWETN
jgi:integrase